MFKYGSFRNFVVNFFVGVILFGFGLIYLTSLYSYSPNDPGFSQLNFNNNNKISGNNKVKLDSLPRVILVPGLGLFSIGNNNKSAKKNRVKY